MYMCIYIYIYIYYCSSSRFLQEELTHNFKKVLCDDATASTASPQAAPRDWVSVNKNILRRRRHVGQAVFKAPNQGEDRSFGYRTAWSRLA